MYIYIHDVYICMLMIKTNYDFSSIGIHFKASHACTCTCAEHCSCHVNVHCTHVYVFLVHCVHVHVHANMYI